MTITVSTTDPRSPKALAVLETADRWQRGHLKGSGRSFFAVPSSADPTRLYLADARECSCPDFRHRAQCCKHILAVRLWLARRKPEERPRRRSQPVPTVLAAELPAVGSTSELRLAVETDRERRARLCKVADAAWGVGGE